jgi:hypothetical protein
MPGSGLAAAGVWPDAGQRLAGLPGWYPVGGPGAPGPRREPFPQAGDIVLTEADPGKGSIVHLVQPLPRISEVLGGQARIQVRAEPISWAGG